MGLIWKLLFFLSPGEVLVRDHGHKRQKSVPPWLSYLLWKSGMHLFRIAYLSWQGGSMAARRDPGTSGTCEPAHHPHVSSSLLACHDPAQPVTLSLPGQCQLCSRHKGICIDLPRAASLAQAPPRVARAPTNPGGSGSLLAAAHPLPSPATSRSLCSVPAPCCSIRGYRS